MLLRPLQAMTDDPDWPRIAPRLRAMLERLKPREERVIRLRFGLHDGVGRTLRQVGDELGVSVEYTRQTELRGLRALKRMVVTTEDGKAVERFYRDYDVFPYRPTLTHGYRRWSTDWVPYDGMNFYGDVVNCTYSAADLLPYGDDSYYVRFGWFDQLDRLVPNYQRLVTGLERARQFAHAYFDEAQRHRTVIRHPLSGRGVLLESPPAMWMWGEG